MTRVSSSIDRLHFVSGRCPEAKRLDAVAGSLRLVDADLFVSS